MKGCLNMTSSTALGTWSSSENDLSFESGNWQGKDDGVGVQGRFDSWSIGSSWAVVVVIS